jgi:hypothetical protein
MKKYHTEGSGDIPDLSFSLMPKKRIGGLRRYWDLCCERPHGRVSRHLHLAHCCGLPRSGSTIDFFAFGDINHCLEGMASLSHEGLLAAIREIVASLQKRPCSACLSTEWKDSNDFLRTMVTIIHKPNIG